MAKKKTTRKSMGGPFLAAAVFCDNIVQGADGALSAIRIIDQITVTIPSNAPPELPSESAKLPVAVWTLLMFKSGSARGAHEIHLAIHSPSGTRTRGPTQHVVLGDTPNGGVNLRISLGLAISGGGLYMVDVLLDGKRVTRMPLVIAVKREDGPSASKQKIVKKKRVTRNRKRAKKRS